MLILALQEAEAQVVPSPRIERPQESKKDVAEPIRVP
jgi:hypothetical protein